LKLKNKILTKNPLTVSKKLIGSQLLHLEKNKSEILALLNLGMSNKLISLYFKTGQSALNIVLKQLKENNEYGGKSVTVAESKPEMLKLLADIEGMTIIERNNAFGILSYHKLNEVLGKIMGVGEILKMLEFFTEQIQSMFKFSFDPDVPQGYRDFLDSCNPAAKKSKSDYQLWKNYLARINSEEIQPPTPDEFRKNEYAIRDQILAEYKIWAKQFIAPHFTISVCQLIEEKIFSTLSEMSTAIVRSHFGIGNQSQEQVARVFNLSPEQTKYILVRELQIIKKKKLSLIFPYPFLKPK